jgi:hypothetical protein
MKVSALAILALAISTVPGQAQVTQDVHARVVTPIASYSKAGQHFEVRVGRPVEYGASAILPPGTVLNGVIREAHRIGLGVRRERAVLSLDFRRCVLPGNLAATCSARLLSIENARENVGRDNHIQGILAASNPNSLFQGIWFRPAGAFLHRSPAGLTGPVGALQNRLAPNPIGAAITVLGRLVLFSLPNADIELPAGTELILRIAASDSEGHAILSMAPPKPEPVDLVENEAGRLRMLPNRIRNAQRSKVADRINFAFLGSKEAIEESFASAGWTTADPLTRKSFTKSYAAFTAMRCYAQAPVSPLYYRKRLPDLVFQKSFNSMAKRHHIRLWRTEIGDREAWLGAATHDVGIVFDWTKMSLSHRVDGSLDNERSKVLNDLDSAQCIRRLSLLDRPNVAGDNTDGDLAVVELKACEKPEPALVAMTRPKTAMPARVAQRAVLEARQYVTRGNAYYWAYRGVRRVASNIRMRSALPAVPSAPVTNGLGFYENPQR